MVVACAPDEEVAAGQPLERGPAPDDGIGQVGVRRLGLPRTRQRVEVVEGWMSRALHRLLLLRLARLGGCGTASVCSARPRDVRSRTRPRLLGRERPVADLARPLVRRDDDARSGGLAVDQPQAGRDGAIAEQALAGTEQDGEDAQEVAVDQVVLDQRLDQLAAPVDLELGAILLLEPADLLGHIALTRAD